MEHVISALDEFFAATYCDYVKIRAIEGYEMPEMVYIGRDGNIQRHELTRMLLCHQKDADVLLKRFKEGLIDETFTYSFRFRTFRELFTRNEFARLAPAALSRCGASWESAAPLLDVEPRFVEKIRRGKLLPEKNFVIALALVTGMEEQDVKNLFSSCGFAFDDECVRDVVVRFLIEQRVVSPELRDACLREYRITDLPIAKS